MATPGTIVSASSLMTPGGDQGSPAYTVTTASFTVPAVGSTVVVTMNDTSWMTPGEVVWVAGAGGSGVAGVLRIQSISGNQVTLLNITSGSQVGDMLKSVYDTNADGVVDHAPWTGITGLPTTFPPSAYWGVDTTNINNYVLTVGSDFRLTTGVVVWLGVNQTTSAGNPTLNVNGTGAIQILNRAGVSLIAGELQAGKMHGCVYDGSTWRIFTFLARYWSVTSPSNPTVECAGFDAVFGYFVFNSATGAGITLAHVSRGIPIEVDIYNGTGAGMSYYLNLTDPAGASYGSTWICVTSSVSASTTYRIDSGTTPTLNSGNHMIISGVTGNGIYK